MKPTPANMTGRATAQDVVMTPSTTAKIIIDYFKPTGKLLEPCRGEGAIYNYMSGDKHWCEISEGKDFMDWNKQVDWIITNPPYSIFDVFLKKAMSVSDNVVFFVPLQKLFKSKSPSNDLGLMVVASSIFSASFFLLLLKFLAVVLVVSSLYYTLLIKFIISAL